VLRHLEREWTRKEALTFASKIAPSLLRRALQRLAVESTGEERRGSARDLDELARICDRELSDPLLLASKSATNRLPTVRLP
jgi:hypothetical protein